MEMTRHGRDKRVSCALNRAGVGSSPPNTDRPSDRPGSGEYEVRGRRRLETRFGVSTRLRAAHRTAILLLPARGSAGRNRARPLAFRPKRYDVPARTELAPVPCRLLFAWECGHGVVVDRAAVTRLRLGSCGALGFTRCKFAGPCRGCPSKRRSGHPCPDRPSERGRCGARLLLHWLGADPVPERALVIERDGGRRHQLVIACRL